MAVILKQAEEKLVEHLEALRQHRMRWKMAVLNGRKTERRYARSLHSGTVVKLLGAAAMECDATVFVCGDTDIVFVFLDSHRRMLPRLKELAAELMPHLSPQHVDFESTFRIHDLGVEYDAMLDFARGKTNRMTAATPERDAVSWNRDLFRGARTQRRMRLKSLVAIIDDDDTIRELAQEMLRKEYAIVLAGDGTSALELYNRNAPDLVLLDINMPGMDGLNVLERIMKADPAACVVMFSAQSTPDKIEAAMKLGAKGFVTKPFQPDTLLHYAARALKRKGE